MKVHPKFATLSVLFFLFQSHAGVGLAASSSRTSKKTNPIEVAIIGGGLSGLTAAYRLGEAGKDLLDQGLHLNIKVYEARNRLGGRVFTVKMGDKPIELGGQNIEDGGNAPEIRKLIRDVGIQTTVFTRPSFATYYHEYVRNKSKDNLPKLKDIDKDLLDKIGPLSRKQIETLYGHLKTLQKKHRNMEEVIQEFFNTQKKAALAQNNPEQAEAYEILKDFFRTRIMTYEGAPASELASTYATGSFWAFYSEMLGRKLKKKENIFSATSVQGGNAQLIEALEKHIIARKGEILRGKPLALIKREPDNSYTLKFKDGQNTRADILVLTLPASVYHKIEFVGEPIPEDRLNQIQKIKYGPIGKIQLPVQSSIPSNMLGSVFTSDMLTWFNRDSEKDKKNTHAVITLYYTGNSKILQVPFDQLNRSKKPTLLSPEAEADHRFSVGLEAIHAAFPKISLPPGDINSLTVQTPEERQLVSYSNPVGVNWTKEEYSLGGYSYISTEQSSLFSKAELKTSLGREVFKLFEPILPKIQPKIQKESCYFCGLYFAGEHTATNGFSATLEGAVHSGNKVGQQIPFRLNEVLNELKKSHACANQVCPEVSAVE